MGIERDEPVTPAGRLFLRPEMSTIIHCLIAGKHSINIDAFRSTVQNSVLLKHPRFTSLLVIDRHGREQWRKTHVDIDSHILVHHEAVGEVNNGQQAVNDYLADLSVSSPLDTDKPLWEIHLLMAHKCAVFRIHHALGDGISLTSMLLSCCRRADNPD